LHTVSIKQLACLHLSGIDEASLMSQITVGNDRLFFAASSVPTRLGIKEFALIHPE